MDKKEVVIEVSHLTKDYGYGRGVFDVTFNVHKGECYGYLGPNGAGKSTTIRHIMGFSKPGQGHTKIYGIDTFHHTDEILKSVGYLPGEPALPSGLDGWGFIRMMQDLKGERNEERLNYLLDLFKLDPDINVREMSLGDKRKLAVVAAFMNDPDVLVLDEPTSGLDPLMQKIFIDFIIEEKKRGKTILLSSHIFSEVEATCDTIAIIKDGKHVSTFKASDIKKPKQLTYTFTFENKESYFEFINRLKDHIEESDEKGLTSSIRIDRKEVNAIIRLINDLDIKEISQKTLTLEDYFLSFYKEDLNFDGLSGVKGNSKDGLFKL